MLTDRQIAEAIAAEGRTTASRLGLRFDRVVVRVLERLSHALDAEPRADVTVLLALTAPIRAAEKMVAGLQREIGALLQAGHPGQGRRLELYGNRAELRLVERSPAEARSLLGFVHSSDVEAATILDLAERWLRSCD